MQIAGTGCSLADFLYSNVDFSSEAFVRFRSRRQGDGGMAPGALVFLEEFEEFAGMPFQEALRLMVGEREPDSFNVGGPSVVPLILVSQLLAPRGIEVGHFGVVGNDDLGRRILEIIRQTPLGIDHYRTVAGVSPFTMVLSDPNYDSGHGERAFVSNIGTSRHYGPQDLPEEFYDADIVLFGATGLVPQLHDKLTSLVIEAKEHGCVTVVGTVYDFRNEKKDPGGRWPLGQSEETLQFTDLLIADREEALSISGKKSIEEACEYFIEQGAGAFAITHGPNPVTYYSSGRLLRECPLAALPVCEAVGEELASRESAAGDTTGCGDNFVGGMIASLATQMKSQSPGGPDMARAVAVGICAGGDACFHLGGIRIEMQPAEKALAIGRLYKKYRGQVAGLLTLPSQLL